MNQQIQNDNSTKMMLQSAQFHEAIQQVLPKHMTPDRMTRIAINCINDNYKLQQCTQNSIASVIIELSRLGLEPNNKDCYIIPYGDKATLMVSYMGMAKLLMRTKLVRKVASAIVCENDIFTFNMGEIEEHRIDYKKPRGRQVAVYCIIYMKNGESMTEVIDRNEIDIIRAKADAKKPSPAWRDFYGEMSRKAATKRAIKHFPLEGDNDEQAEHIARVHKVIDIDNRDSGIRDDVDPRIKALKAKEQGTNNPMPELEDEFEITHDECDPETGEIK